MRLKAVLWVAVGVLLYLIVLVARYGYTFVSGLEPGPNFDVIGLLLLMFACHRTFADELTEQMEELEIRMFQELRDLTRSLVKANVIEGEKD